MFVSTFSLWAVLQLFLDHESPNLNRLSSSRSAVRSASLKYEHEKDDLSETFDNDVDEFEATASQAE